MLALKNLSPVRNKWMLKRKYLPPSFVRRREIAMSYAFRASKILWDLWLALKSHQSLRIHTNVSLLCFLVLLGPQLAIRLRLDKPLFIDKALYSKEGASRPNIRKEFTVSFSGLLPSVYIYKHDPCPDDILK